MCTSIYVHIHVYRALYSMGAMHTRLLATSMLFCISSASCSSDLAAAKARMKQRGSKDNDCESNQIDVSAVATSARQKCVCARVCDAKLFGLGIEFQIKSCMELAIAATLKRTCRQRTHFGFVFLSRKISAQPVAANKPNSERTTTAYSYTKMQCASAQTFLKHNHLLLFNNIVRPSNALLRRLTCHWRACCDEHCWRGWTAHAGR